MKICLISISGLTISSPDVRELSLSAPGFSSRLATIAKLPSLAMLTLSGATPASHQVEYLEVASKDEIAGLAGTSLLAGGGRQAKSSL